MGVERKGRIEKGEGMAAVHVKAAADACFGLCGCKLAGWLARSWLCGCGPATLSPNCGLRCAVCLPPSPLPWPRACFSPPPSPPLQVTIISRHPADEVLVMASDGLWDVMSNQEAVTLAKKCLGRARSRGSTRQVSNSACSAGSGWQLFTQGGWASLRHSTQKPAAIGS